MIRDHDAGVVGVGRRACYPQRTSDRQQKEAGGPAGDLAALAEPGGHR
jgi:hypothetical protein